MSIRDDYAYHMPDPDQLEKMTELRTAYSGLAMLLDALVAHGRYYSLARTSLEESAMWANKAVILGGAS